MCPIPARTDVLSSCVPMDRVRRRGSGIHRCARYWLGLLRCRLGRRYEQGRIQKKATEWMEDGGRPANPGCHEYRVAAKWCSSGRGVRPSRTGITKKRGSGWKQSPLRSIALGLVFEWKRRQAGGRKRPRVKSEAREWMKAVAAEQAAGDCHEYRAACAICHRAGV